MMNDDINTKLVMLVYPYLNDEQLSEYRMKLDMLLHDYTITKNSTALTVYQGDVNEKALLKFLEAIK